MEKDQDPASKYLGKIVELMEQLDDVFTYKICESDRRLTYEYSPCNNPCDRNPCACDDLLRRIVALVERANDFGLNVEIYKEKWQQTIPLKEAYRVTIGPPGEE